LREEGAPLFTLGMGAYTPIPMLESNVTAMHDKTKNSY
jgi:hypothetical protein